ncbi:hypothetical protein DEH18_25670 [Streptomyces sp. NHF165]|nr:hypothetical protein DEH18_25670 [Streptomyces sp. NHF165]
MASCRSASYFSSFFLAPFPLFPPLGISSGFSLLGSVVTYFWTMPRPTPAALTCVPTVATKSPRPLVWLPRRSPHSRKELAASPSQWTSLTCFFSSLPALLSRAAALHRALPTSSRSCGLASSTRSMRSLSSHSSNAVPGIKDCSSGLIIEGTRLRSY